MKKEPVVVERTYDAPVEKVWQAITDKDQMKEWYFDVPEFKAEPGCEFSFKGKGKTGEQHVHLCKVTTVEVNRKLAYSWQYKGQEGYSEVTFDLTPVGNKTKLRLTHTGLHTFPAHPDFVRENFEAGWTELIGRSLRDFVEEKQ